MHKILDFATSPARLLVRNRQLVVRREGEADQLVPLRETAIVIVSQGRVTYSNSVLVELALNANCLLACFLDLNLNW